MIKKFMGVSVLLFPAVSFATALDVLECEDTVEDSDSATHTTQIAQDTSVEMGDGDAECIDNITTTPTTKNGGDTFWWNEGTNTNWCQRATIASKVLAEGFNVKISKLLTFSPLDSRRDLLGITGFEASSADLAAGVVDTIVGQDTLAAPYTFVSVYGEVKTYETNFCGQADTKLLAGNGAVMTIGITQEVDVAEAVVANNRKYLVYKADGGAS